MRSQATGWEEIIYKIPSWLRTCNQNIQGTLKSQQ